MSDSAKPLSPRRPSTPMSDREDLGTHTDEYFRYAYGRRVNTLNSRYMLPADEEEIRRMQYHHRMVQFIFEGKNYVGPVQDILTGTCNHKRRVLDLGTGGGLWAVEMADEFPNVDVIGVDIAPIQPLEVPPNCEFELCDLDTPELPYPNNHFDVIHVRSLHTGIRDYAQLIREVTRMLRPGGLVLLVELDSQPVADGKRAPEGAPGAGAPGFASGAPGWFAVWDAYRRALITRGIDVAVPRRLGQLIWATRAYDMSKTFAHEADIPIGFHPKDPTLLTVGQLAWMDFDLLLNSLRPYLFSLGLQDWQVENLIEDAQSDLYYPVVRLSSRLHVVRGIKK